MGLVFVDTPISIQKQEWAWPGQILVFYWMEEGTERFGHTIDIEGLKFKQQKRHLHQTFAFSSQSGLDHWSTPGGIEKLVKFVSSAPLVVGNHWSMPGFSSQPLTRWSLPVSLASLVVETTVLCGTDHWSEPPRLLRIQVLTSFSVERSEPAWILIWEKEEKTNKSAWITPPGVQKIQVLSS